MSKEIDDIINETRESGLLNAQKVVSSKIASSAENLKRLCNSRITKESTFGLDNSDRTFMSYLKKVIDEEYKKLELIVEELDKYE